jgi:hypothetical protein
MTAAIVVLLGAVVTCESEPVGPSQCSTYDPSDLPPSYHYELGLRIQVSGQDIDDLFLVFVEEVLSPDSTRALMGAPTEVRANSNFGFGFPAPAAGAVMDVLVTVSDVAANCSVAGDNPVATQLKEAENVWLEFAVTCVAV